MVGKKECIYNYDMLIKDKNIIWNILLLINNTKSIAAKCLKC